jgi:hypothetical protein
MAKQENKKKLESVKVKLGRQTPIPKNSAVVVKPKNEENGETK